MSRPIDALAIDGASSTGPGEVVQSKGHPNVMLFVIARNFDSANDTLSVALEVSPNGEDWDTLTTITGSDISEETASVLKSDVAAEQFRANITDFTDAADGDLQVDAFVSVSGNPGTGYTSRTV